MIHAHHAVNKYHAVWVRERDPLTNVPIGDWKHHMSCDTRADADEEAHYCQRTHNEEVKVVRQDW